MFSKLVHGIKRKSGIYADVYYLVDSSDNGELCGLVYETEHQALALCVAWLLLNRQNGVLHLDTKSIAAGGNHHKYSKKSKLPFRPKTNRSRNIFSNWLWKSQFCALHWRCTAYSETDCPRFSKLVLNLYIFKVSTGLMLKLSFKMATSSSNDLVY